jgi:hypothetical protein
LNRVNKKAQKTQRDSGQMSEVRSREGKKEINSPQIVEERKGEERRPKNGMERPY